MDASQGINTKNGTLDGNGDRMNGRLWVLKASQNGYTSRLTPRKWGVRTGDRAAEGTGLLNRRRALRSTAGSNPALSVGSPAKAASQSEPAKADFLLLYRFFLLLYP